MAAVADSIAVGPRVRALRDAMGLSLRELAERCGVSAPMLSQVERGETSPTLAVAQSFVEARDFTCDWTLPASWSHTFLPSFDPSPSM